MPRNNLAALAHAALLLSASAQAANYRFGATQDRVVSDEEHGYTQHIAPDFEVQDGIAVTYVRLGRTRVARLVSTDYAARVYTDVAPLDGADGKISAGDAWISQQATSGAVSLPVAPTAVARLLFSGARRILYESAPTTAYFAHDPLGSLTVETDAEGAVVGRRTFSPFGAERAASGDSDSYGFTGQRQDAGGTVHFSFRQLDPATGRWSSTDPLFHVATPGNLGAFGEATTAYAYVANNPANHIDPTGLTRKGDEKSPSGAHDKIEVRREGASADGSPANVPAHGQPHHADSPVHRGAQADVTVVAANPTPAAAHEPTGNQAAAAGPAAAGPAAPVQHRAALPHDLRARVAIYLPNPHQVLAHMRANDLAHRTVLETLGRDSRDLSWEQAADRYRYFEHRLNAADGAALRFLAGIGTTPDPSARSVLEMDLEPRDGDSSDSKE